jgi:hypothetical protein
MYTTGHLEEDCGGGRELDHWVLGGGLWKRKRARPLGTWRRTVEEEES